MAGVCKKTCCKDYRAEPRIVLVTATTGQVHLPLSLPDSDDGPAFGLHPLLIAFQLEKEFADLFLQHDKALIALTATRQRVRRKVKDRQTGVNRGPRSTMVRPAVSTADSRWT